MEAGGDVGVREEALVEVRLAVAVGVAGGHDAEEHVVDAEDVALGLTDALGVVREAEVTAGEDRRG